MPYIVTTKRLARTGIASMDLMPRSRRAVATLEEGPDVAQEALDLDFETFEWMRDEVLDLPESGGTVGPLPDGTVIEVERS